jgi:uncharacterized protein YndB with AHSA1/START domain
MAAIRREVVFEAPPEEVWQALTRPERLREWFANDVQLDVRPGGTGVFRWDDGSLRQAVVEDVEEERRLAFRWSDEDGAESRVELVLDDSPEGTGTRLTVTETATAGIEANALAGEWSWGVSLLAALPRLRRPAFAV